MESIQVWSPAKLNLVLRVLGRRPDGYHELVLLNTAVDLYDRVEMARSSGTGLRVECAHPGVPAGPDNLAARAAEVFFQECPDLRTGLSIKIEKHVPVAGGLGGGSGNAAAVLWGLPRLLGAKISNARLMELGAELGSDVPFFLFESPAWATGRGERLHRAEGDFPDYFVVVKFPFGLSTAEVFGEWDRRHGRSGGNSEEDQGYLTNSSNNSTLGALRGRSAIPLPRDWNNDLGPVASSLHGEIGEVLDSLLGAGAEHAQVSGSGPTAFGVFQDEAKAFRAREEVGRTPGLEARLCRSLRGPVLKQAS